MILDRTHMVIRQMAPMFIFDVDKSAKDSHTHRLAGAREVLVSSARRWALMHELRDEPELTLVELLSHIAPVDLVIRRGVQGRKPSEDRSASQRGGPAPALSR